MLQRRWHGTGRYAAAAVGLAVLAAAVGAGLLSAGTAFLLCVPPIALAARVGGGRCGLLAAALAALVHGGLTLGQAGPAASTYPIEVGLFLLVSALVSWCCQPIDGRRTADLEAVLRAVPIPVWIAHDPACSVVTGNPAACALLKVDEGVNISQTPSSGDAPGHYQVTSDGHPVPPDQLPLQAAARLGVERIGVDLCFAFDSGEMRHLFGNAVPLWDESGAVRGAIAAFIDVTSLKQAEAALRAADRSKDDFLAVLAHELRNPLASMKNAIQIMELANGDPHTLDQARAVIERQLQQLVRHADDLLDVSRISRGKILLCREPVNLRLVLTNAAEAAAALMVSRRHELVVTVPDDPLPVDADPVRLTQVVANLLNNAARYTAPGGRIVLELRRAGDQAEVRVTDNGIGIPAEALPNIFGMFSQVDRSMERVSGGLGIGLALVKAVVELHGGTVEAHSDGAGRGSTFVVRLPLRAEQLAPPVAANPRGTRQSAGPRRKVLIVDDNEDAADSLAMLLDMMGHEVHLAHDGEKGIAAAAALRPDLVLMDVGMPGMNGLEATRRIRAEAWGRAIKVVALTGLGQEVNRRQTVEAGCDGHLTKPVGLDELTPLLAQLTTDQPA
ncbi:MAG: ATP-binding protein [Gemmataceae bacterium]